MTREELRPVRTYQSHLVFYNLAPRAMIGQNWFFFFFCLRKNSFNCLCFISQSDGRNRRFRPEPVRSRLWRDEIGSFYTTNIATKFIQNYTETRSNVQHICIKVHTEHIPPTSLKPYSLANSATIRIRPLFFMTLASKDNNEKSTNIVYASKSGFWWLSIRGSRT